MAKAEVDLQGMDELISIVTQMGKNVNRIENKALRAGAQVVKDGMKDEIRRQGLVKTGKMLDSVDMSRVKTTDFGKYIEIGPGGEAYYWLFVDLGTRHITPRQFTALTVAATERKVYRAMEDVFLGAIGL